MVLPVDVCDAAARHRAAPGVGLGDAGVGGLLEEVAVAVGFQDGAQGGGDGGRFGAGVAGDDFLGGLRGGDGEDGLCGGKRTGVSLRGGDRDRGGVGRERTFQSLCFSLPIRPYVNINTFLSRSLSPQFALSKTLNPLRACSSLCSRRWGFCSRFASNRSRTYWETFWRARGSGR